MRPLVLAIVLLLSQNALAQPRIISLAPHLTEWVYSLESGEHLVAVSDYSDYPAEAKTLPRVASYQGVNFTAVASLKPSLILAWEGGNRPQDIARLRSLGLEVFSSRITEPEDIAHELQKLGKRLQKGELASRLATQYLGQLEAIRAHYQTGESLTAFYYSWTKPLMSIGERAWANKLLKICGAESIFKDSPVDYPQVSLQQVLLRSPDILIAAQKASQENLEQFWQPHRYLLKAPLIVVNPDVTSRFTLRLIPELTTMCKAIHSPAT